MCSLVYVYVASDGVADDAGGPAGAAAAALRLAGTSGTECLPWATACQVRGGGDYLVLCYLGNFIYYLFYFSNLEDS